jgi:hypothetical protein
VENASSAQLSESPEERDERHKAETERLLKRLSRHSSKNKQPKQVMKSLPADFRVTSADRRIAQSRISPFGPIGETLMWDDKEHGWIRTAVSMTMGKTATRMFIRDGGKDGRGAHYFWDKQKQLWFDVPNPPKPPPEGTRISHSMPGVASTLDGYGSIHYQWSEDDQEWIRVDDVPSGYTEVPATGSRLEAAWLENWHIKIHWDQKRRMWINPETGEFPQTRPLPPPNTEFVEEYYSEGEYQHEQMVKVKGEEKYYLWSKAKQRWVLLADVPEGFHRGGSKNEAFNGDGKALDRWLVWDNDKEQWVDFDSRRREITRGRIV